MITFERQGGDARSAADGGVRRPANLVERLFRLRYTHSSLVETYVCCSHTCSDLWRTAQGCWFMFGCCQGFALYCPLCLLVRTSPLIVEFKWRTEDAPRLPLANRSLDWIICRLCWLRNTIPHRLLERFTINVNYSCRPHLLALNSFIVFLECLLTLTLVLCHVHCSHVWKRPDCSSLQAALHNPHSLCCSRCCDACNKSFCLSFFIDVFLGNSEELQEYLFPFRYESFKQKQFEE